MAEHVVLAVAQPDRPSGRGMKLQASPVKAAAVELGIPVETPEKAREPSFVSRLRALDADFLLVASYGQILSMGVLESARQGGINLHGSLLPRFRGAAPIQRAIELREAETGITLMQMDRGMDTGEMIAKVATPIGADETYGELQDRLAAMAAEMIAEWAPRIASGDYPREAQNSALATLAPKISREETQLRFSEDATRAYARFRAFSPSPGSFLETRLGRIRLSEARLGSVFGPVGEVLAVGPELTIGFANGSVELRELQPEGKRRMRGRDWANGARLRVGDSLV
jgi:methionyl-tRNA formyltransferase